MMVSQNQPSHRRSLLEAITYVTLPSGLWLDNRHLREVGLHPLTGYDETHLLALRGSVSPARWVSELLARCVTSIEEIAPVPLDYVQALTVGDREALLLQLRRLTFGERLSCIFYCPQCDSKLDVDLNVGELLLPTYAAPGYWFRLPFTERDLLVTFRLPNGADQEAVATLAESDPRAAATALLARCLHSVYQDGVVIELVPEELLLALVEPLAAAMSKRDPQAELLLDNQCPECEYQFNVLLDMSQFLADEINQRLHYLYREVHLLAWYYHWSEADIMQMTRLHRKIYLDLLDETLSEVAA